MSRPTRNDGTPRTPPTAYTDRQAFEAHTEPCDQWFEDHEDAYRSELAALRR